MFTSLHFQESDNETSQTLTNVQTTTEPSYSFHSGTSEVPTVSSALSSIIATQPSFKKLFLSEAAFPHNLSSNFIRSRVLKSPFRWSRSNSSKYSHHMPTLIQINAGKRVIKKYRRFARILEYKRLHSIIPSLSKRKYASKVIIYKR